MPQTNSTNREKPTTLRRSPRILHQKNTPEPEDPKTPKPRSRNNRARSSSPISTPEKTHSDPPLRSTPNFTLKKTHKDYPPKVANKPNVGSKKSAKSNVGSKNSPRLNNGGVEGFQSLRRSPRFINRRNTGERVSDDKVNQEVLSDVGKVKVSINSSKQFVEKVGERTRHSSVGSLVIALEGGERKARDMDEGNKVIGVKRKRKQAEEGHGVLQGWTKDQELALQRAYFAANPTPHFWKKVAKLVPGKSAQDCFDKVHSDHLTPPQPRPRSRANRTNSSSLGYFSLSASKLLKPTEPKIKRPSCNKQKSHLAQKTVRHLLQKHYHVDQDNEADLFSVLEPTMNPSTQAFQQNGILSTPEHVQEKTGFLRKCRETSSSGHKKPLSRFSSLCGMALVSPPVLKQVKNKALHEKYIDQLHCREAKRKAASVRAAKSIPGKENRKESHVQKMDVVRAAKNALVSDARDAINQFQHLQANAMINSFDFDGGVDSDDNEGEDGP